MATRKKRSSAHVDVLLEEMLVDAYGDDEQLTALAEGVIRDPVTGPNETDWRGCK